MVFLKKAWLNPYVLRGSPSNRPPDMFWATEVVKTIVQYLEDMDGDDEFWADLELLFKFTCPKTERHHDVPFFCTNCCTVNHLPSPKKVAKDHHVCLVKEIWTGELFVQKVSLVRRCDSKSPLVFWLSDACLNRFISLRLFEGWVHLQWFPDFFRNMTVNYSQNLSIQESVVRFWQLQVHNCINWWWFQSFLYLYPRLGNDAMWLAILFTWRGSTTSCSLILLDKPAEDWLS